ncbi:MAG: site-specific DNA-methyltransferase [Acetobacterales bacterium]
MKRKAATGGMRVKQMALSRLVPYARNAKQHPKRQIEALAKAIKEFGFRVPVLVEADGSIIAGHGRVLAAEAAGLKKVPAIEVTDLSEKQVRALRIADNKIAELGKWDDKLLAVELGELQGMGVDLGLTGFRPAELGKLVPSLGGGDDAGAEDVFEDELPVVPATPVSRTGDLWLLGSHRVLCGDSTRKADVSRLLAGGADPLLMVTDPPYGVNYDAKWRNNKDGLDNWSASLAVGKVENDDRADWRQAWRLFPGQVAYVWHGGLHAAEVEQSLTECDFELRAQIIWVKQHFAISRGAYHWKHKPCWYAVRKGKAANWQGDRKQTTVWEITNGSAFGGKRDEGDEATGHSTQKPIKCMLRPILNHTQEGDAVYEPFAGSGSTMIAAEQSKRICYAVELNPAYVDVVVKRWQQLTGREAVLEGEGRSFSTIAGERRSPQEGSTDDAGTAAEADASAQH